jgi:hypothetical protein
VANNSWHLNLRAWNAGTPSFPLEPALSPLEIELTDFLVSLQAVVLPSPLLGPNGSLAPAVERMCPLILESGKGNAGDVLVALNDLDLDVVGEYVETFLESALLALDSETVPGAISRLIQECAAVIAEGAVAINLVAPPSPFLGVVTCGWIVATAARVGQVVVLRERPLSLVALQREVQLSCLELNNGLRPTRLASHIYADMLKGKRRGLAAR